MTDNQNPSRSPRSGNADPDSGAVRQGMFRSRALAVGVAQSVLWITLGVIALRVVPFFQRIYADFNSELPGTTIAVVSFTAFLRRSWFLVLPAVLSWPFINWGIDSLLSPRPGGRVPRWLWRCATWLLIVGVVVFVVVALFLPLASVPQFGRDR